MGRPVSTEPIRIVIEGPPPRKNERHELVRMNGHSSRKNSQKYESFAFRLMRAWDKLGLPKIERGLWAISVHSYWKTLRHLPDLDVPKGDSDAALSCIKDALQLVEAIDNDGRIVSDHTENSHDKQRPRVEIELTPRPTPEIVPATKRRKARAA